MLDALDLGGVAVQRCAASGGAVAWYGMLGISSLAQRIVLPRSTLMIIFML